MTSSSSVFDRLSSSSSSSSDAEAVVVELVSGLHHTEDVEAVEAEDGGGKNITDIITSSELAPGVQLQLPAPVYISTHTASCSSLHQKHLASL